MEWLSKLCIGHLENTDSRVTQVFQMLTRLTYNIKKSLLLISSPISLEKCLGNCQAHSGKKSLLKFPQTLIFYWKFYHWWQLLWVVFPWVVDSLFVIFVKMYAKYSGSNNHIFCQAFFQVKTTFQETKQNKMLVHLATQITAPKIFLETAIIIRSTVEMTCANFPFSHIEY